MPHARERQRNARRALRVALLGLVVLAPLPFGGVTSSATLAIRLAAFTLAAAAGWIALAEERPLPRKAGLLALAVAVPFAVGLVQSVPLPAPVTAIVAPRVTELREELAVSLPETRSSLVRASLDTVATREALLTLAACVAVGFTAAVAVRRERHLRTALTVLAVAGACQAAYGAVEYLSGHQQIFGYVKRFHLESATGTFVNRNHFAGYLAILLPTAVVVALDAARRLPPATGWRDRVLRLNRPESGRVLVGGVACLAIWSGVLLSYSRGGLAAAAAGVGTLVLLCSPRRLVWWAAAFALPVVVLLAKEIEPPGARLLAGAEELGSLHGRLPAWSATATLARDFLPLGTGLGTFEAAFPLVQPATVRGSWSHAHNDWLEVAAEGGPLVALAIVALAVIAMLPLARGREQRCRAAVSAALAAAVIACFIDFCARIPGIAITVAALVGMSCCAAERTGEDDEGASLVAS